MNGDPFGIIALIVTIFVVSILATFLISIAGTLNQDQYQAGYNDCKNEVAPRLNECALKDVLIQNTSSKLNTCNQYATNITGELNKCIEDKTVRYNETEIKENIIVQLNNVQNIIVKNVVVYVISISVVLTISFKLVVKFILKRNIIKIDSKTRRYILYILASLGISLSLAFIFTLLEIKFLVSIL